MHLSDQVLSYESFNNAGSVSIKPTPSSYYEAGGILNKGGMAGGLASAADVSALAAKLDRNNQLLAQLVGNTGSAAKSAAVTAAASVQTAGHTSHIKNLTPPRERTEEDLLREDRLRSDLLAVKRGVTL